MLSIEDNSMLCKKFRKNRSRRSEPSEEDLLSHISSARVEDSVDRLTVVMGSLYYVSLAKHGLETDRSPAHWSSPEHQR